MRRISKRLPTRTQAEVVIGRDRFDSEVTVMRYQDLRLKGPHFDLFTDGRILLDQRLAVQIMEYLGTVMDKLPVRSGDKPVEVMEIIYK